MNKTITEEEWTTLLEEFKYRQPTINGGTSDSQGMNSDTDVIYHELMFFYGVQWPNGKIQAIGGMRDRDAVSNNNGFFNSEHEKMRKLSSVDLADIRNVAAFREHPLDKCKILLLSLKQEVIDSPHRKKLYLTDWSGATIGDYTKLVDIHATEHDFGTLLAGTENFTYTYNTKQKAETRDIKEMMI